MNPHSDSQMLYVYGHFKDYETTCMKHETTCINDSTAILSLAACGQDTILARHYPLTDHYFEPWGLPCIFNPVSPGHPLLANVSSLDLFFSFTPVYITGHPSCLDMNIQLVAVIQTYPWQCMECKTCIICRDPFDEVINRHGPPLKIPYLLD